MPWSRLSALAVLSALALTAGAAAHTTQQGDLQVVHPWVAPAQAGASTEAHPTLVNTGDAPLRLVGATSPAAESVELLRDGARVETIAIDPGATLAPPQFALRLRGLAVDLPAGRYVPLTLHLRDRAPVELRLAIGQDTMDPQRAVELPGTH